MLLIYLIFLVYVCGFHFEDARLGVIHPCRNYYRNLAKRSYHIYILSYSWSPFLTTQSVVGMAPAFFILPPRTIFCAGLFYSSGIPPNCVNYHWTSLGFNGNLLGQIDRIGFIVAGHDIYASCAISPLLVTILTDFVPFFIMICDTR